MEIMGYSEQAIKFFCGTSGENRALVLDFLRLSPHPEFSRRFREIYAAAGDGPLPLGELRALVTEYKAATA